MKRNNDYLIGNQFAKGNRPNQTSFKAGSKPWNSGLKGWCQIGSRKTQFKKGVRGIRYVPIGTIKIRTDKNGKRRRWIKISDGGRKATQWSIYATWLWIQTHGPMPVGMFIHHLDGDSMNDRLSNYALVTRAKHINEHRAQLVKARTNVTPGLPL